jgi:general secretion pathway protein D
MKKITSYFSRFILVSLLVPHYGFALDQRTQAQDSSTQGALSSAETALIDAKTEPENPLTETKKAEPLQEAATIEFNYVNEDITNIINSLATKKGVNVIIPLGANALANKVTLSLSNRITLDEAWAFLQTFLDLSGYSMIPRGDMYYITKKNNTVAKEPLPLFVGMKPSDLPDTDERIRYIYYLSNIKVSDAADNELATLLKDLLPQPDGAFKMDPPSNGLIISARSREIKSLMEIIVKLDKVGFLEKFEIFRLRFTNAKDVAELFNNSLLKADADPNRYRLDTKRTTDATYFSKFTRIIPDGRTNSLIILGRFQAIERIKEFIRNYIDVKIESGKSPLHIYDLQYLKAEEIAPILESIIKDDLGGGTGQSQAGAATAGGTQRSFGEVKILADTPKQPAATTGQETASLSYYGGNKLVIACSHDDWQEIEKLIQSLDQPRSQVLIEVLIADLTVDDLRELGTSIRNPGGIPMPGNMNFQTTNLENSFETEGTSPNETIKADLLYAPLTKPLPKNQTFVGRDATQGSMAISFNDADGKVWGVAEIAKNFGAKKILSAPHMIATNNKKASIIRAEKRLLRDQSSSTASNSTIAFKWVDANLTVNITPRISDHDDVTMQIEITVNQFKASTTSTDTETPVITTRELSANATVGNNNVLVLGGLVRLDDSSITNSTPLLGKIPILRWFFSARQDIAAKTNLTIFIKPIVIRPRLRAGLQEHTQEFLKYIDNYTGKGSLFESLKDPVTKIFFANEGNSTNMVHDFMRFKQEEIAKSAGAPIQNVDLTDGSVSTPKKERQRKKEAQLKKNRAAQALSENESMRAETTPSKNGVAQAEHIFSENEAARADRAKKLLQDTKNPLIDRQQEPENSR